MTYGTAGTALLQTLFGSDSLSPSYLSVLKHVTVSLGIISLAVAPSHDSRSKDLGSMTTTRNKLSFNLAQQKRRPALLTRSYDPVVSWTMFSWNCTALYTRSLTLWRAEWLSTGFGFIHHLQVVTTNNCNTITNFHTIAYAKSFQSAVSSSVVPW
jgi:hypothetical protein